MHHKKNREAKTRMPTRDLNATAATYHHPTSRKSVLASEALGEDNGRWQNGHDANGTNPPFPSSRSSFTRAVVAGSESGGSGSATRRRRRRNNYRNDRINDGNDPFRYSESDSSDSEDGDRVDKSNTGGRFVSRSVSDRGERAGERNVRASNGGALRRSAPHKMSGSGGDHGTAASRPGMPSFFGISRKNSKDSDESPRNNENVSHPYSRLGTPPNKKHHKRVPLFGKKKKKNKQLVVDKKKNKQLVVDTESAVDDVHSNQHHRGGLFVLRPHATKNNTVATPTTVTTDHTRSTPHSAGSVGSNNSRSNASVGSRSVGSKKSNTSATSHNSNAQHRGLPRFATTPESVALPPPPHPSHHRHSSYSSPAEPEQRKKHPHRRHHSDELGNLASGRLASIPSERLVVSKEMKQSFALAINSDAFHGGNGLSSTSSSGSGGGVGMPNAAQRSEAIARAKQARQISAERRAVKLNGMDITSRSMVEHVAEVRYRGTASALSEGGQIRSSPPPPPPDSKQQSKLSLIDSDGDYSSEDSEVRRLRHLSPTPVTSHKRAATSPASMTLKLGDDAVGLSTSDFKGVAAVHGRKKASDLMSNTSEDPRLERLRQVGPPASSRNRQPAPGSRPSTPMGDDHSIASDTSKKSTSSKKSRTSSLQPHLGHKITRETLTKEAKNKFNMGKIYVRTKNFPKAKELFAASLRARMVLVGPEHPIAAEVHEQLGDVARLTDDHTTARRHYSAAVRILKKALRNMAAQRARDRFQKSKGVAKPDARVDRVLKSQSSAPFGEMQEDPGEMLKRVQSSLASLDVLTPKKDLPMPNLLPRKSIHKEWDGTVPPPTSPPLRRTSSYSDFLTEKRKEENRDSGEEEAGELRSAAPLGPINIQRKPEQIANKKAQKQRSPRQSPATVPSRRGAPAPAFPSALSSLGITPRNASRDARTTPGSCDTRQLHTHNSENGRGERRPLTQREGWDQLSDLGASASLETLSPSESLDLATTKEEVRGDRSRNNSDNTMLHSIHSTDGSQRATGDGADEESLGYASESSWSEQSLPLRAAAAAAFVFGRHRRQRAERENTQRVVVEGLDEVLKHPEEVEPNADMLAGLGKYREGDYAAAMKLFRSALHSKVIALGTDHEHVSLIREKLGDTSVKMGRNLDAERYYDLAVRNLQAKIGSINEDVARILASQGDLYRKMGKHGLALRCYKESLSVRRELLDIDRRVGIRPSVGTSHIMNSAGIVHARRGSFESANSLFSQVFTRIGSDADAEDAVPYVLNSIGNIRFKQGEYAQAVKYYKKSLKTHLEIGGTRHNSDVCGTMSNLGKAYFANNEFDQAIECLATAAKRFRDSDLASRDLEIAALWTKIGSAYFKKKNFDTAMEFYMKSLKAKHVLLKDDNHPEILLTRHDIGLVLYKQGRLDNAMTIFEDIKRKRAISGNTNNADFAKLLIDMSATHLKRGGADEVEKAERLCDAARRILEASKIHDGHPYARQVHNVMKKINYIKLTTSSAPNHRHRS